MADFVEQFNATQPISQAADAALTEALDTL